MEKEDRLVPVDNMRRAVYSGSNQDVVVSAILEKPWSHAAIVRVVRHAGRTNIFMYTLYASESVVISIAFA